MYIIYIYIIYYIQIWKHDIYDLFDLDFIAFVIFSSGTIMSNTHWQVSTWCLVRNPNIMAIPVVAVISVFICVHGRKHWLSCIQAVSLFDLFVRFVVVGSDRQCNGNTCGLIDLPNEAAMVALASQMCWATTCTHVGRVIRVQKIKPGCIGCSWWFRMFNIFKYFKLFNNFNMFHLFQYVWYIWYVHVSNISNVSKVSNVSMFQMFQDFQGILVGNHIHFSPLDIMTD